MVSKKNKQSILSEVGQPIEEDTNEQNTDSDQKMVKKHRDGSHYASLKHPNMETSNAGSII